jgi:hypothetical protein
MMQRQALAQTVLSSHVCTAAQWRHLTGMVLRPIVAKDICKPIIKIFV